jgi:hypothetical protein
MKENENQFTILFSYLSKKLAGSGLTKDEIESFKGHPVGHQSLESFIAINMKLGNFQWRGDRLVNADRKFVLGLNRREEEFLRLRAQEAGMTEAEFVNEILVKALLNN